MAYPGAICHVMNRGDRREPLFRDDADRRRFVGTLGEACGKTGGQVYAYVRLAPELREKTTVTVAWIARRLHMGTRGHLTHLLYWQGRKKGKSAST